jgi:hypothetical protein
MDNILIRAGPVRHDAGIPAMHSSKVSQTVSRGPRHFDAQIIRKQVRERAPPVPQKRTQLLNMFLLKQHGCSIQEFQGQLPR